MNGQAYTLERRKVCEQCGEMLTHEEMYLYFLEGRIHTFCVPSEDNNCYFDWYQNKFRSVGDLRDAGLL